MGLDWGGRPDAPALERSPSESGRPPSRSEPPNDGMKLTALGASDEARQLIPVFYGRSESKQEHARSRHAEWHDWMDSHSRDGPPGLARGLSGSVGCTRLEAQCLSPCGPVGRGAGMDYALRKPRRSVERAWAGELAWPVQHLSRRRPGSLAAAARPMVQPRRTSFAEQERSRNHVRLRGWHHDGSKLVVAEWVSRTDYVRGAPYNN